MDYEAFADCFTEDAQWRIAGLTFNGRNEIVSNFRRLMSNFDRVLMTFRTPVLSVGDRSASARTYVTEENVFKNGNPGSSIAVYFERFVDQGDRWRFSWRLFQLEYFGKADLSGQFFENPDFGMPPMMPAVDAPTYDHSGLSTPEHSCST
jgi:hypothetical protein